MKNIFKIILKYYLQFFARLVLLIHRPFIIAISGSTNKHFVKKDVENILSEIGVKYLTNDRSYNTEIGLPLAILSLPSGYNNYSKWLPAIKKAPFSIFQKNFPKVLILELGVSDSGDMKYLLKIVKPNIAVITEITRRYLEGFEDMEELAGEYEYLLKSLNASDLAILNFDNAKIKKLKNRTKAKIVSFGQKEDSNWQALEISKSNEGQSVKVSHNNIVKKYFIKKFGNHHIYSLLISLAIKEYYAAKH